MKIPPKPLCVLQEEGFQENMAAVMQQLETCRKEGTFAGFDGETLYYECFQRPESRGAVVVVHGLSEFTRKFHEFAWYLLEQGYDVFLYDQRCHGRSCRLTDRQDMIHVDQFDDYYKDLDRFVRDVVRKATDLPLYLYAHSMGGAVAVQHLACYPDVFQKAVLSAPMIMPLTGGVPLLVAQAALCAAVLFGKGKKKFWAADEFDPDYPFERSHDQSRARFLRNMEIRLANPCYCTTPLTVRWVQQSLTLRAKFMKKPFLQQLRTPILMICGGRDQVVCAEAQKEFAEKCPVCRRVVQENATHSMLCGTPEVITEHLEQVLTHFA